MLKSIGVKNFFERIDNFENNKFLENLSKTKDENFYGERQLYTDIQTLGKIRPSAIKLDKNNSAEIHRFKDFNIVEFTTKACALDYDSMDALKIATDKPLIIINEKLIFRESRVEIFIKFRRKTFNDGDVIDNNSALKSAVGQVEHQKPNQTAT